MVTEKISSELLSLDSGFYEFDELNVSIVDEVTECPQLFLKNYPNPFNPITTFSFFLQDNNNVQFVIFNIKGQKIRTIIDSDLNKGKHDIEWNGMNDNGNYVTSGVYFYKLSIKGKKSIVKKCLLLK